MFHVVYSNAYEILQTYLRLDLEQALFESKASFPQVSVVVGTKTLADKLRRDLSDQWGVCAGIQFQTAGAWLSRYLACDLSEGSRSSDFLWTVWSILTPEFTARYDRLNAFFNHALENRTPAMARYDLAVRIADTFALYVNYRLDWVLQWMGISDFVEYRRWVKPTEKQVLESQPDLNWQKDLWKAIYARLQNSRLDSARSNLEVLSRFRSYEKLRALVNENQPHSLFIFMPMALSPMALPIFKALNDADHDVRVYLFNPCREFWFDSYDPETQADAHEDDKILLFLRRNAASTRALINRFDVFAEESESPDPRERYKPHASSDYVTTLEAPTDWRSLRVASRVSRTDLNLAEGDGQAPTVLHALQKAVLMNDASELPETFTADDHSFRIIKAPTAIREVENAVDMIQAILAEDQTIKPSDILVVTPDIEGLTPAIDATFEALPESRKIQYRIAGQWNADEAGLVQALLDLGKLIFSRFDMQSFTEWLELPVITRSLNLAMDDLAVIKDWLIKAGFREGLSKEQLAWCRQADVIGEEVLEGTFDRALERLCWGYVTEGEGFSAYDVLPVRSGKANPYSETVQRPALFESLLKLSHLLKSAFEAMPSEREGAKPQAWLDWTQSLVDDFFALPTIRQAVEVINLQLRDLAAAFEACRDEKLPIEVFWQALTDRLEAQSFGGNSQGAVTFAGMSAFRRIPFKAVIMLGMNESSGFPGHQRAEEFNLMAVPELHRQGDRDSRKDNRNIFLDLILSARRYLVISYSVGLNAKAPLEPSPVVLDCLELLNANTGESVENWDKPFAVQLPLTATSEKNFEPQGNRFWACSDQALFETLGKRSALTELNDPEPFSDAGFSDEALPAPTVGLDELIAFYSATDRWLLKRLGLSLNDAQAAQSVPINPELDRLSQSILRSDIFRLFDQGLSADDVLAQIALDPSKGAYGTRRLSYESYIHLWYDAYTKAQAFKRSAQPRSLEDVWAVPGFESERFSRIAMRSNEIYEAVDDQGRTKRYLFAMAFTQSAILRAYLKQWLFNAAGYPLWLALLQEDGAAMIELKLEPVEPSRALELARLLMQRYNETAGDVTSNAPAYSEELVKQLWRGRSWEEAAERRAALDQSIKEMLDIK